MAEERPRTLKVLEALSKLTEPTSPADIASMIAISPRDTNETLYDLGKAGFAEKPDGNQSLWLITDKGRKYIENPPVLSDRHSSRPLRPTAQTDHQNRHPQSHWVRSNLKPSPSQSDLFKGIAQRLSVGAKKGDIHLDNLLCAKDCRP